MSDQSLSDEEREARRARRREEMRREKQRQEQLRRRIRFFAPIAGGALCLLVILFVGINLFAKSSKDTQSQQADSTLVENTGTQNIEIQKQETESTLAEDESRDNADIEATFDESVTDATVQLGSDIISTHAIVIDVDQDTICAQKDAKTAICPASMTKVLTILVAAEHITDLDDTFTMTIDITDYCYVNDLSTVGFAVGEKVSVRDLFYGTILPSGGEAAMGLAVYVAGSQEAFVEMMNDKLEELGVSDTAHFTNCVGLYDKDHYCSVYDMAIIMKAAADNELCKEVMSTHTYTTSKTTEHPDGITISNWFLRRIEDKDSGGEVVCGKTGYVVESGNCAASYAVDSQGKAYVCVTADANSGWRCIYDHVALYKQFRT